MLIQTKLHPPQPSSDLIERSLLIQRLNQNGQRLLTLVIAPAGYGKSTLLSSWLESLSDQPTAWRTIRGYEVMHMIRKGQIAGVEKGNIQAQNRFIAGLFGLGARAENFHFIYPCQHEIRRDCLQHSLIF